LKPCYLGGVGRGAEVLSCIKSEWIAEELGVRRGCGGLDERLNGLDERVVVVLIEARGGRLRAW
jgi:hypothetical protein